MSFFKEYYFLVDLHQDNIRKSKVGWYNVIELTLRRWKNFYSSTENSVGTFSMLIYPPILQNLYQNNSNNFLNLKVWNFLFSFLHKYISFAIIHTHFNFFFFFFKILLGSTNCVLLENKISNNGRCYSCYQHINFDWTFFNERLIILVATIIFIKRV